MSWKEEIKKEEKDEQVSYGSQTSFPQRGSKRIEEAHNKLFSVYLHSSLVRLADMAIKDFEKQVDVIIKTAESPEFADTTKLR
jgi:hypothetical protein|tara:strand:- start:47 stop:295 length:249 start_codon:yes stop_codon:yes gene_type:complete